MKSKPECIVFDVQYEDLDGSGVLEMENDPSTAFFYTERIGKWKNICKSNTYPDLKFDISQTGIVIIEGESPSLEKWCLEEFERLKAVLNSSGTVMVPNTEVGEPKDSPALESPVLVPETQADKTFTDMEYHLPTQVPVIADTQDYCVSTENKIDDLGTPIASQTQRTTPRSLESMLATQSTMSPDLENTGIHTLVQPSMLPSATSTPTQQQLTRAQKLLVQADNKVRELEDTNMKLHNDMAAANAAILIKEEEIQGLQVKITLKQKSKSAKANIIQTDNLKKQLKVLQDENKSLKDLKNDDGRINKTTVDSNYYAVLMNEGTENICIPSVVANNQQRDGGKEQTAVAANNHQNNVDTGRNTTKTKYCHDTENCSNPVCEKQEGVLYFRGFWDPLSPFYNDNVKYKGQHFKTSEHAYHHEKAIFHKHWKAAREIYDAPSPAQAKTTAKRCLPTISKSWTEKMFDVMKEIMMEKAQQCKQFRDKLVNSGSKKLVHNMECDAVWGFGEDGLGRNEMGKILMCVRDCLKNVKTTRNTSPKQQISAPAVQPVVKQTHGTEEPPTKPKKSNTTSSTPPKQQNRAPVVQPVLKQTGVAGVTEKPSTAPIKPRNSFALSNSTRKTNTTIRTSVHVLGNSNVTGIAQELHARNVPASTTKFTSGTSSGIAKMLGYNAETERYTHIVVHSGDIDIRKSTSYTAIRDHSILIDTAIQKYPNTRILINTLPETVNDPTLKSKINKLNDKIIERCATNPWLTAIDCSKLKLRDSIHLSEGAKNQLARKIVNGIHWSQTSCI